jgi:hypothetical protein
MQASASGCLMLPSFGGQSNTPLFAPRPLLTVIRATADGGRRARTLGSWSRSRTTWHGRCVEVAHCITVVATPCKPCDVCYLRLRCLRCPNSHCLCPLLLLCCSQAVAFFPPHQLELTHALGRWTAAAMWVVKAMVRPGSPLKEELQGEYSPEYSPEYADTGSKLACAWPSGPAPISYV